MPKNNDNKYSARGTDTAKSKREQEIESGDKVAKVAAKGAATYFGGPAAGKAVDMAANTKLGKKAIHNTVGKNLNRNPNFSKMAKKLDDAGLVDAADKGIDALGGKGGVKSPNGKTGGGQSPLPSSSSKGIKTPSSGLGNLMNSRKKSFLDRSEDNSEYDEDNETKKSRGAGEVILNKTVKKIMLIAAPIILIFILIVAIITTILNYVDNFGDALGAAFTAGEELDGQDYYVSEEANEFFERINNVKLRYQAEGKTVDEVVIAAVYNVIKTHDGNVDYKDMSERDIEKIADAMFNGNSYDEELFRENLVNDIFRKYFPLKRKAVREIYADEVFEYIDNYKSFIGEEEEDGVCGTGGSCTYDIKGFRIGPNSKKKKSMQISNLQVRLMQCGAPYGSGSYTKALDQPMVEFEKYITGVAYAEIGTGFHEEAIKAQLVAARSYSLARPTAMNNQAGKKLAEENGQWVLQLSSCVADQVFCNIDEGCSYMGDGEQGGTVRSGKISGAIKYRAPLPADNKLRTIADQVKGEVVVDEQGYILNAGYVSTIQNQMNALAKKGYNYKQILLQIYNKQKKMGASDVQKMSCGGGNSSNCGVTGPYANWKQMGSPWSNIRLGSSSLTIGQAGCLVTSMAMLIAKSGVPVNIQGEFNPGTFVKYLNSHGGFIGANFVWASPQKVAPTFKHKGSIGLSGKSKSEKLRIIKEKVDAGYYVVLEVKGNTGQHWVAIDRVEGNNLIMMDPASKETVVWKKYPAGNSSIIHYYKVEG